MVRKRAEGYPSSAQMNLPTSAVGAIGGGFISFALCVVLALTLFRMFRTWQGVRRRRIGGEDITFRREWQNAGGFWGFISTFNGNSTLAGASGRFDELRWMIAEMGREKAVEQRQPDMWEVEVQRMVTSESTVEKGPEIEADETLKPMAVNAHGEKMPTLGMSVLILMPNPHREDDAEEDLPDMVVGTMAMIPIIAANTSTESVDKEAMSELDETDGRRATWQGASPRTLEGL